MNLADMVINEMQEELDSVDIEDQLNDLMADLVAERQNEAFLSALFWGKPGTWSNVASLCAGLETMKHRLGLLEEASSDSLYATWVEYPAPANSEGFCLIVFFSPGLQWSNTAIYNKARLLRSSHRNGVHR